MSRKRLRPRIIYIWGCFIAIHSYVSLLILIAWTCWPFWSKAWDPGGLDFPRWRNRLWSVPTVTTMVCTISNAPISPISGKRYYQIEKVTRKPSSAIWCSPWFTNKWHNSVLPRVRSLPALRRSLVQARNLAPFSSPRSLRAKWSWTNPPASEHPKRGPGSNGGCGKRVQCIAKSLGHTKRLVKICARWFLAPVEFQWDPAECGCIIYCIPIDPTRASAQHFPFASLCHVLLWCLVMLVIVSEDFCSCSEIPVVVRKPLSLEISAGCCCYCSPIPEAWQVYPSAVGWTSRKMIQVGPEQAKTTQKSNCQAPKWMVHSIIYTCDVRNSKLSFSPPPIGYPNFDPFLS